VKENNMKKAPSVFVVDSYGEEAELYLDEVIPAVSRLLNFANAHRDELKKDQIRQFKSNIGQLLSIEEGGKAQLDMDLTGGFKHCRIKV